MTRLSALLDGRVVGRVDRGAQNRLSFRYEEDWRESREAYPLSLSMPLTAGEHAHASIESFLWGLLPDNVLVLDRWAKRFQVSARSAFGLISHVGEDCAGAIQFVRPERLDALLDERTAEVDWLDDRAVAVRLRTLRADHAAWRGPSDAGQFSLAGAQPKTALLLEDGRWGVPSGRTPTTHILKPPTSEFDGHAENEHLCLALASELGLPTARSEVRRFEDEVAIVIERYDRTRVSGRIHRVHQEDVCQALGVAPTSKYQNEGGPGPERVVALLRAHSSRPSEDVATFVDALVLNWLIAGTDAHAKNYSLLHGAGARVRLAPLYDIASALPYGTLDMRRLKLAMKIGGEYRVHDVGAHQWRKLGHALGLDAIIDRAVRLAASVPERMDRVRDSALRDGLAHPVVDRLASAVVARAAGCVRDLERS